MAFGRRPACDFSNEDEIEDENPSISQLVSQRRDSFRMDDFDRLVEALVAREAKLKHQNKIQKIEIQKLEIEKLELVREYEALESRILRLEVDTMKLFSEMFMGGSSTNTIEGRSEIGGVREDDRNGRTVINLENVFDYLIAAHANGNLQTSVSEAKLKREIKKQRSEFAALEKKHNFELQEKHNVEKEYRALEEKHQFELQEKHKVENEYKALEQKHQFVLQEKHKVENEYKALEEKHQFEVQEKHKVENEYKELERKHQFELQEKHKVENEYKELERKHQFEVQEKLKVEDELKECKAELQGLKEKPTVANEKYEKLLEEVNKGRKDEDEEFTFDSRRKNNELESISTYAELDSEISRLDKLINSKRLGSTNKEERNKHSGMADGSRKKKCNVSSDHVINVEDLCDSVPASASSRGSGFHSSGTPKFSPGNAILISDSDDDCAPGEKKLTVLKRKRASSPNTSDNDDGGDKLERDIIPTTEMKQCRKLSRCGSLVNHFSETVGSSAVSDYGKQNNSSSSDQVILRPSEEKIGEKQKSSIKSPAKVSNESDDSSTSIVSSDDSEDEDEYLSLFSDVVKKAKA